MTDKPSNAEQLARHVAEEWLAVTTAGDAEESWSRTSDAFRQVVSSDQWARALDRARDSRGAPMDREFRSAEYTPEFPGSPPGHYVVVTFETTFEKNRGGVEMVVPTLDGDGTWRVAGYFVR